MKGNGNIEKTELDKWAADLLSYDEGMLGRAEIGDRAFAIGLKMDCSEDFCNRYGVTCFDLDNLREVVPGVSDLSDLGNLAFSQWRGITHWGNDPDERTLACLRLVLRRIIELTK